MNRRNRKNRGRPGFTLVELLVVISIIGMLMALLLPAVQSARESGRSNTCRNNMRNCGLAITAYEAARNIYPGYVNDVSGNPQSTALSGENTERSWVFVILPYMDHRALYDTHFNSNTLNADITQSIEVLQCPSNPPEAVNNAGCHYVVNTGQLDRALPPTTTVAVDYAANGVFHRNAVAHTAAPATRFKVVSNSAAYVAGGDGLGTTLMVSENSDAATWMGIRDVGVAASTAVTGKYERWLGFTYNYTSGTPGNAVTAPYNNPISLNVRFGESKNAQPQTTDDGYTRPSAFHPNGLNVMFCDNHVRFLSDSISYGIFQALMTPKGNSLYDNAGMTQAAAGHAAANTLLDENSIR